MKFTLSWLKRHLDTDATLERICDVLTQIGLEVEDVQDRAADFAPFKVAYVEKAEQHPDADRLKVCTVKTENETFQVVCGAPNARTGMKGIFAPEGAYIPGLDVTLKKAKIRGVESRGMLVSEREMCLSDEHEGIIEVDEAHDIGTPMAEVFGLNDPIIEIALTPNRADCAGVYGIARDLAAAGLGALKTQDQKKVDTTFLSSVSVSIENKEDCPYFAGRTIKNIQNKKSPQWFQDLLQAVGLRPISALVDITNFMTMDHARPLHVYDIKKLKGNIHVRAAEKGEKFEALNDKSYETQGGEIAICDDRGLIGLGGIVGGVSTGVDEHTAEVFLESAYFDPSRIARTGRDLGIITDARYRFERGVDPSFTNEGIEIATQLILDFCGTKDTEISEIVQAGQKPIRASLSVDANVADEGIAYDPMYLKSLIGIEVDPKRQIEILQALGFICEQSGDIYSVTPPSWRGDIYGRADLVEEIIRIVGFDHIPSLSVRHDGIIHHVPETLIQLRARHVRHELTTRGFNECVTWSFTNRTRAAYFGSNDNAALALSNPISEELSQMRPSILPNLIEAAIRNTTQGYPDVALFEIGPVFQSSKPDGQVFVAAGVRTGSHAQRHWSDSHTNRDVDFYDIKADAYAALRAIGGQVDNAQIVREAPSYYHPGRSGALCLGKTVLAYFGELHPMVLDQMDMKGVVCGFEVFIENLPVPRKKSGTNKPFLKLSPLQPVHRDFAFSVSMDVEAASIVRAIKGANKALIRDVQVFDVYTGQGVTEGHKSVAVDVTIHPHYKTLTDKDLDELSAKITDAVAKRTGGVLRA